MNDVDNIACSEAHLSAGLELEKQQQWQEAAVQYQRAIELAPDCARSHYQLGLIWSRLQLMDIALSCHQTAFDLNPDSYLYCTALAMAIKKQGMFPEALDTFQTATTLEPANPDSYHQIGDIHLMKKRFADAVSAYNAAIDRETEDPWTYVNLGRAYNGLCQYRKSIHHIRHAMELRPNIGACHLALGEALTGENCMQEAFEEYSKAIQLEPNNTKFRCALGEFYNKDCRYSDAISCFVEIIKEKPQHQPAYKPLGYALHESGVITRDEMEEFCDCIVPDRIVDSLFYTYSIEEVNFESDELHKLATEEGENINLSPKSITASEASHNEDCSEIYLESALVLPAYLLEIEDGRAWFDGINTAVMTASGKVIKTISERNRKVAANISQSHEIKKVDGVAVFISQRFAAGFNYFHWFFQDIARLQLLELAGIELSSIDKFIFVQVQKNFQQETLDILGIPASKVIQSIDEPHVSASRLLVPSLTDPVGTSKWACKFLRDRFVGSLVNVDEKIRTSKKIYITRNGAAIRKVVNEDDLIPLLKYHGFEIVKLETLSIQQKVALLDQVEVIITPHGAALTNLVFCNPGTKVVEIFPQSTMNSMDMFGSYPVLSHQCELDHHYFFADNVPNQEAIPQIQKDLSVNVDKFKQMLALLS